MQLAIDLLVLAIALRIVWIIWRARDRFEHAEIFRSGMLFAGVWAVARALHLGEHFGLLDMEYTERPLAKAAELVAASALWVFLELQLPGPLQDLLRMHGRVRTKTGDSAHTNTPASHAPSDPDASCQADRLTA